MNVADHLKAIERHLGKKLEAHSADLYALIGSRSDATEQEIRIALKQSAATWNASDRANHPESALTVANLLKLAQATLLNVENRHAYDIRLSEDASLVEAELVGITTELDQDPFKLLDVARLPNRNNVATDFGTPEHRMAELAWKMPSILTSSEEPPNKSDSRATISSPPTATKPSAIEKIKQLQKARKQRKFVATVLLTVLALAFVGFAGFQFFLSQSRPQDAISIASPVVPTLSSTKKEKAATDNQSVDGSVQRNQSPTLVTQSALPKLNRDESNEASVAESAAMLPDSTSSPPAQTNAASTMTENATPSAAQPATPPEASKKPMENGMKATWKDAMKGARDAAEKADFDAFGKWMEQALAMESTPIEKAKRARLDQLGQLYKIFMDSIKEAKSKTRGTEAITVGNNLINLVEVGEEVLVVRIKGENQRYPWNRLPMGIAMALADLTLDSQNPTDVAARGVYLSLSSSKNELSAKKAKELFAQSVGKGEIRSDLAEALTDTYD